jgi:hypothetical protein
MVHHYYCYYIINRRECVYCYNFPSQINSRKQYVEEKCINIKKNIHAGFSFISLSFLFAIKPFPFIRSNFIF